MTLDAALGAATPINAPDSAVPPRINPGLSPPSATSTMTSIFGAPGELTTDRSPVTQKQ